MKLMDLSEGALGKMKSYNLRQNVEEWVSGFVRNLFVCTFGILLFSTVVQGAAPQCKALFNGSLNAYISRITIDVPSPFTRNEYAKFLQGSEFLLGGLLTPEDVKIVMTANLTDSYFNPMENLIHAAVRAMKYLPKEPKKTKKGVVEPPPKDGHPKEDLAILAHEYGHATLEVNLRKLIPEYARMMDQIIAKQKRFEELLVELNSLETMNMEGKGEEEIKVIKEKIATMSKEFEEILVALKNKKPMELRGALHELFADIFAVTLMKDPHAISHIFPKRMFLNNLAEHQKVKDIIEMRDFTVENVNTVREWSQKLQNYESRDDIYSELLPARWELWGSVKSHIKSENYRQNILPKMVSIIQAEMLKMNDFLDCEDTSLYIKEMNKRISKEIREKLSNNF